MAGRGLLDMKAGLAAGLAVCEAFARDPGRQGNLLFIAVPDEEGNSAGARRIAEILPDIGAEYGLDLEAAINLDATVDDGDGEDGRAVALGTVGKLLPSALVVGRPAHASDSFRGFGAAALAGALAAEMEWLPDLTERTGDELGAGPTLLGMKDDKTAYDVTTPASVWMYWNIALHRHSARDVLAAFTAAAQRAAGEFCARLKARSDGAGAGAAVGDVDVIDFKTILAEISAKDAPNAAIVGDLAARLAQSGLALPEQCRLITETVWALSGRQGPAIVTGFASTPYLATQLGDDPSGKRLAQAVRGAAEAVRRDTGLGVRAIRYFPGISDVSFFGQADRYSVEDIAANTPAWRTVLGGAERFATGGIPTINAGPWGRDYHTRLERMHKGYCFEILPGLLAGIVERVLAQP
jgi:arginine utilization protein RocB